MILNKVRNFYLVDIFAFSRYLTKNGFESINGACFPESEKKEERKSVKIDLCENFMIVTICILFE